MVVIGSLDFFAGLVAIINDRYYTVTRDQMVLIHDVSHWGWVTLIWGSSSSSPASASWPAPAGRAGSRSWSGRSRSS